MKQNVKLLFDRRNTVKKTGKGTIEILVYLSREERKWEAVGTADEQSWEVMANDRRILTKANSVVSVKINGSNDYNEGDWVRADDPIEIRYYLPESQQDKAERPQTKEE